MALILADAVLAQALGWTHVLPLLATGLKPRKHLKATYRAASSEFEGTLNPTVDGKPVPDISGLRKPVEIAQEVADEVIEALDKLSRYLGRNPEGRESIEAHASIIRLFGGAVS